MLCGETEREKIGYVLCDEKRKSKDRLYVMCREREKIGCVICGEIERDKIGYVICCERERRSRLYDMW